MNLQERLTLVIQAIGAQFKGLSGVYAALTHYHYTRANRTVASANNLTISYDTDQVVNMNCTEAAGTFTWNAPTGTKAPSKMILVFLSSTNQMTFSWNAAIVGTIDCTLPAQIGAGKEMLFELIYSALSDKLYLVTYTNIK